MDFDLFNILDCQHKSEQGKEMNFEEIESFIDKMCDKQCDKCRLGFDGIEWRSEKGNPCPVQAAIVSSEDIEADEIIKQLVNEDGTCLIFEMLSNQLETQKEKLF